MKPNFFTCIKNYSMKDFSRDIIAGIIVAIVALPLSIALGIASGVSPEKGLHTAIIAGFIISFLGGSRVQIGGPTGAFMIIVYGIISDFGLEGLIIATIMGGIIMILMGVFKLGTAIKFIPRPITIGFTSGIAVTIFSSQVNDFLGLNLQNLPPEFIGKWQVILSNLSKIDAQNLYIAIISLLIIILFSRRLPKIPGTMIALLVGTLMVQIINMDIMTIGKKFGDLSSALPSPNFNFKDLNITKIEQLIAPAFTIAILGAIESLMSAVVADGMIGAKHRSNTELIAQGIANIASGIFGGVPATGAIARTVTNINNGGRTPVAGMVHAVVLLLILLLFMPYAQMIPLASLAAILMMVAYNMSGWREFKAMFKAPKSDLSVLLFTFFITVLFDLVIAIGVGMVLAALLFMKRMADVSTVSELTKDYLEEDDGYTPSFDTSLIKKLPENVQVYEVNGAMFFGVVDRFLSVITDLKPGTEIIIMRLRHAPSIDSTAMYALKRFLENCKDKNIKVIFSGLQNQPYRNLEKAGILDSIGKENIFDVFEQAIIHVEELALR